MSDEPIALPEETIANAIAAFDAGNHAWGRYRHFMLPTAPQALVVPTTPVRDALAEAAISVPDAQAGEIAPLLDALRATVAGLRVYRDALPGGVPLTEIDEALDDFAESIALLEGRDPEAQQA